MGKQSSNNQPKKRRFRQISLIGIIVIIAALIWIYRNATSPDRLRAILVEQLAIFDHTNVDVGEIAFTPWQGLTATSITVTLSDDSPLTRDADREHLPIIDIDALHIDFEKLPLLFGRVKPTDIHINEAVISLISDADGRRNINFKPHVEEPESTEPLPIPEFSVNHIQVKLQTVESHVLKTKERWSFSAAAKHDVTAEGKPCYSICLRRKNAIRGDATLAAMQLTNGDLTAHASTDWLPIGTLRRILRSIPIAEVGDDYLDEYAADGELRISDLTYDAHGIAAFSADFRKLKAAFPVEIVDGNPTPPETRFLQFAAGDASIGYNGETYKISLIGTLCGAQTTLSAHASPHDKPDGLLPFTNDGKLKDWDFDAQLSIQAFPFPTTENDSAFLSSPRLHPSTIAFFRDYEPHGNVNIDFAAQRIIGIAGSKWHTTLGIEAIDVSCIYQHFPYPVEHVRGGFRVEDGVVSVENLVAQHGNGIIYVEGGLDSTYEWTGLDLRFTGINIPLDEPLYNALPREQRSLWDNTAPIGTCDINVHLTRPNGTAETGSLKENSEIDAKLIAGSLAFENTRITHVDADISVRDGELDVQKLNGNYHGATLLVAGNIEPQTANDRREHWHVEVGNMPVTQSNTFAVGQAENASTVTLAATANVRGQIWRTQANEPLHVLHTIQFNNGTFSSFTDSLWDLVAGSIVWYDDLRVVHNFRCTNDMSSITINGQLENNESEPRPKMLSIHAKTDDLGVVLTQIVPPPYMKIATTLRFAGAGELTAVLQSPQDGSSTTPITEIDLSAASMKADAIPLPLNNVNASLTITNEGFQIRETTATYGNAGTIKVTGKGTWRDEFPDTQLSLESRNVQITDAFVDAMPTQLAAFIRPMTPKGKVNATIDNIRISSQGPNLWDAAGSLEFEGGQLDLGMMLDDFDGRLEGTCRVDQNHAVALNATFAIRDGLFAGRPLTECTGMLSAQTDPNTVAVSDVTGRLCGGELRGHGTLNPKTNEYLVEISLNNVGFDEFVKPDRDPDEPASPAKLDGIIHVNGHGKNTATRKGGGRLRIRGASILKTPILADVAQVSQGTRRQFQNNAESIELEFSWEGVTLNFDKVDIRSGDTHLIGKGYWNINTNAIGLTLLAAPINLPEGPLLEIVDIAREELAQFRIEGTLKHPKVTIEPLHNVTEALREALGDTSGAQR